MIYPDFLSSNDYLSLDTSRSEKEQVIALSEKLKALHLLTSANYKNFDELILEYLKEGLQIFNMEIGIVSKIIGNEYIVCNAISPDNSLNKDDVFPLEGTYCYEVFKSQKVLGFPHVGSMNEMKEHPVYMNMKLESYLSAPIYVNEKLFGTLNFTSTSVRDYGFSVHERDLISLMANSIGSFVALGIKEDALISANDRLKRLVGFVSHDLRTPLGNIISLIQLMDESDKEERIELSKLIENSSTKALEMVHTILEMAAMGTGKIELNLTKVDIKKLLLTCIKKFEVSAQKKLLNIKLSCIDDSFCQADLDRLEQVLTNLYSNAVRYTPENGTIHISMTNKDNKINFSMSNSMSESSKQVSKDKNDQSIGFGLEIVREILILHNSSLSIICEDSNYVASFQL